MRTVFRWRPLPLLVLLALLFQPLARAQNAVPDAAVTGSPAAGDDAGVILSSGAAASPDASVQDRKSVV